MTGKFAHLNDDLDTPINRVRGLLAAYDDSTDAEFLVHQIRAAVDENDFEAAVRESEPTIQDLLREQTDLLHELVDNLVAHKQEVADMHITLRLATSRGSKLGRGGRK